MTEADQVGETPAETPPQSKPEAPSASVERSRGGIRRVLNWFWRGSQLKALRREAAERSAEERALASRAELLLELGHRALRPNERLPSSATAAATELYRQSVYFGVRAVSAAKDGSTTSDPWQALPSGVLEKLGASSPGDLELTELVEGQAFVDPWALPEEQRSLRAARLAAAAKVLVDEANWRTKARDALWIQRLLRVGLVFGVVFGTIFSIALFEDRSEQSRDLAYNKPWRASSSMSGFGCNSPLQKCADSPDFFFHTLEETGPWVEIDLGAPTRFSSVRIDNRRDCCFDRAAPLIVEISKDQQRFKEVSRRTKSFTSWRANFTPIEARYVRVRAPSRTMLHLSQVRVLP